MKSKDEIMKRYNSEIQESKKSMFYITNSLYTLGWVLGFSENEIKNHMEEGTITNI